MKSVAVTGKQGFEESQEDESPGEYGQENNNDQMFSHEKQNKLDWQQIFLEEKLMGEPQAIPQSIIYELVNETINKEDVNINCPRDGGIPAILKYLFQMPLTHTQYISIPSPLSKRNDNYYPLTLVQSVLWIFVYTFVIVWFTYDVTVMAFN